MHDVFHMSLLEQNTTKKEQVDKGVTELELEAGNSKKYVVEAIGTTPSTSESQSQVNY